MAISIDNKPYLRLIPTSVTLPRGEPIRKGNLVFLLSDSIGDSISMINNKTVAHNGYYRYYYYDAIYQLRIYGIHHNIRLQSERPKIYERVCGATKLIKHPMGLLTAGGGYNTFFDMSKYMEVWKAANENKSSTTLKFKTFFTYLKSILNRPDASGFRKFLLIDLSKHVFKGGSIRTLIDNPVFCIYYALYKYPELVNDLDMDIIFYVNGACLKVNFAKAVAEDKPVNPITFKREVSRLMSKVSKITIEDLDEKELKKEESQTNLKEILSTRYNFLGDNTSPKTTPEEAPKKTNTIPKRIPESPIPEKATTKKVDKPQALSTNGKDKEVAQKKVSDAVEKFSKDFDNDFKGIDVPAIEQIEDDAILNSTEEALEEDEEAMEALYNVAISSKVKTSAASSARDAELRAKHGEIKVKGMKLKDIDEINATKIDIPSVDVSSKLHTTNQNFKQSTFTNFEKVYNEKCLNKDIIADFECLADKPLSMQIVSVDIEDSSNELNYKETWRVVLEDFNRTRHTVSIDVPKFVDDKFLYLGGNKKTITKQNFFYPVVKTGPDTVQIVTNYNKVFIRRMGTKSFSNVERLVKFISKDPEVSKCFSAGNAFNINTGRMSTIEFDELSKNFYYFKNNGVEIFFDRNSGDRVVPQDKVPKGYMMAGTAHGKPIFINLDTQMTDDDKTIIDIIIDSFSDSQKSKYEGTTIGKRLLFNTATIMAQTIPLISLLGYWEGLTTVLKKAGIKYTISQKKVAPTPKIGVIRFSDCYLSYENTIEAELLLNGINVFNTRAFTFEDFDDQNPYVEYFRKVYGKAAIVNTLTNAYEFLIDPITLEILKDLKLPEDIVSLAIHASNLLADNDYTSEGKEWLYRVRSNEIIPAILYATISRYYIDYRNSGGKKKLSIPRDALIKQILMLQTVEDYSVLNPVVEAYKTSIISCKGFRGANLDDAYNEEKRSYDPSMTGIMAMSTSPDGNCGINRELVWEPNINNARGYLECKEPQELKDINLFSVSELVTSLSCTRDDPIRIAMAGKQTRHIVPTANSSPVLISNGVEEAIKYKLGSDFIVNADEDGEVVEMNEKTMMMVVKYKSGKYRAVDLSSHMVKNGAGGFYLSNQLITDLKVGDKFKANDTLAWHKDYFTKDAINGVRMNVGSLTKVAIMSNYNTYQDGSICTMKLAESMKTAITLPDTAVIGKNSNIEYMVKVGDHVEVGDSLIQFDESFEETELNKFLATLGDKMQQTVMENSRNNIKASHPGIVKDIKIYATSELEEMSESLQAVVGKYYKGILSRKAILEKYDKESGTSTVKCGTLFTETTGRIEPNGFGVVKGHKVENGAILFEFYIEHGDQLGVGDKAVLFTANKVVIDEVVPPGYEPFSEYHPEEEVSILAGESAILKRMIPSVVLSLLGNKCLVELKRKLQEIYES